MFGAFLLTAVLTLQHGPAPCGWSAVEIGANGMPSTLDAIIGRRPELRSTLADALPELERWIHGCHETAGRRAILKIRNLADSRSDAVVRGILGVLLLRGPEVQVVGSRGMLVRATHQLSNAEQEGARLVVDATRSTGWQEFGEELARVALSSRRKSSLESAETGLRRLPPTAAVLRLLAEVQLARGNLSGARSTSGRPEAVQDPGSKRIAGILLLRADSASGWKTYLEGLNHGASTMQVQEYVDDILPLLDESEFDVVQSLAPEELKSSFLPEFWERRAYEAGIAAHERAAIHFRRLADAFSRYGNVNSRIGALAVLQRADYRLTLPFSDKGLIYIRLGHPDAVFRLHRTTREAWGYRSLGSPGGVLEFEGSGMLAELPACDSSALQDIGTTPENLYIDYGSALGMFDLRVGMYMTGCYPIMKRGSASTRSFYRLREFELRSRSRALVAQALRTENAAPSFENILASYTGIYAFRAEEGTEIVSNVAVAANTIRRNTTGSYAFSLQLAVSTGTSSVWQDTTLTFTLPSSSVPGQVVSFRSSIVARPATEGLVRVRISNDVDGDQGMQASIAREIPDFGGAALGISDIVISQTTGGSWRRGTEILAPTPGHQVAQDTWAKIYYEVYNLTPGATAETQITIAPASPASLAGRLAGLVRTRGAQVVRFREDTGNEGSSVRQTRELKIEVEEGAYVLTVAITDLATGRVVERQTELIVLKP